MILAAGNALQYLFFAVLAGTLLLQLIPATHRPALSIPFFVPAAAAALLPVVSFVPIAQLTRTIASGRDMSFFGALERILFQYEVGQSWVVLFVLSFFLFGIFILFFHSTGMPRAAAAVGLVLIMGMIGALGASGHAANAIPLIGGTLHFFHLLAVSLWIGTLLMVSWFGVSYKQWASFLEWFTLIAVMCVIIIAFTGVIMGQLLTDPFIGSWALPYGEALIWKHLFYIVILIFALFNGIFIRRRLHQDENYNPRQWLRAESLTAILIFVITAFMTEQEPGGSLRYENPAFLFHVLYPASVPDSASFQLQLHPITILSVLLSIGFLYLMVQSFHRGRPPFSVFVLGCMFVLSAYTGLVYILDFA